MTGLFHIGSLGLCHVVLCPSAGAVEVKRDLEQVTGLELPPHTGF